MRARLSRSWPPMFDHAQDLMEEPMSDAVTGATRSLVLTLPHPKEEASLAPGAVFCLSYGRAMLFHWKGTLRCSSAN